MSEQPKTAWGRHVQNFMDHNPGISYRQAQTLARHSYKSENTPACAPPQDAFNLGTFNILAHGLERDGFLCPGGEEKCIVWERGRANKVANVLAEMIKVCACVVTQENDEFFWLLNQIRRLTQIPVTGYYCVKTALDEKDQLIPSNARILSIKSMLMYILKYKYHSKVITAEALEKMSVADVKPRWDEFDGAVNAINRKENYFPTFKSKLGRYAKSFAKLYGKVEDDVYVSDDGIGFYFNPYLARNFTWDKTFNQIGTVEDVTVSVNKDGFAYVKFEINQKPIIVYGAHLPSGEDHKKEGERIKVFQKILEKTKKIPNPSFILMDSNTNYKYEREFAKDIPTLSQVIGESRFEDAVPSRGMECFKMRSTKSEQKEKWCELMFDTIDKQLYPVDAARSIIYEAPLNQFGFVRYNPIFYNQIKTLRIKKKGRKDCELTCRKVITDDALKMFPSSNGVESPFHHIYPGPESPSDHPPVMCSFVLYDKVIDVPDFDDPEDKLNDKVNNKLNDQNNKANDQNNKANDQNNKANDRKDKTNDKNNKANDQKDKKIGSFHIHIKDKANEPTGKNNVKIEAPPSKPIKMHIKHEDIAPVDPTNKNKYSFLQKSNADIFAQKPNVRKFKLEGDVNCKGLDKEEVLRALFNAAKIQDYTKEIQPMTEIEASEVISASSNFIKDVRGRNIYIDFYYFPTINAKMYDEFQGKGKVQEVIANLKKEKEKLKNTPSEVDPFAQLSRMKDVPAVTIHKKENNTSEDFITCHHQLTSEAVLSALYNAAKPIDDMLSRHSINEDQAKKLLSLSKTFEKVDNRALDINFKSFPQIYIADYDKNQGQKGFAQSVITQLTEMKNQNKVLPESDNRKVDCSGLKAREVLQVLHNKVNTTSLLDIEEIENILKNKKGKNSMLINLGLDFADYPRIDVANYDSRGKIKAYELIDDLRSAKKKRKAQLFSEKVEDAQLFGAQTVKKIPEFTDIQFNENELGKFDI